VKERVVRDATEHVFAWITQVGGLVLAIKFDPGELRRMDTVPLP
jgi:hypothetical protein